MQQRPIIFSTPMVQAILEGRKTMTRRIIKGNALDYINTHDDHPYYTNNAAIMCPYGQIGDILWVRETFFNHFADIYSYKADVESKYYKPKMGWKPAIHMPKDACRLFLKITGIKVERLHEITEDDAQKEGAELLVWQGMSRDTISCRNGFISLWLEINGTESWNSNPWVWVISFKCIEKPEIF